MLTETHNTFYLFGLQELCSKVIQGYITISGAYKVILLCPQDHTCLSDKVKETTGMEGVLRRDIISIIDKAGNSRRITRLLWAKIKKGVYSSVTSIFSGFFQLPLSFQMQFIQLCLDLVSLPTT